MKSTFSLQFFDQFESSSSFTALENIKTIYHYSIPNTKLFYPEPFIASPSFMHSDLWFVHILLYQYWLWFVFIFLIVFFFTMFLVTIRWCNMRVRPRRETRGVSRSKCGDLITATVPVTWAASIIVNESTDAIDYYDGFGTTELVIGIRAYQWGWEYYYPKDIDLNYNLKPNYSIFIGNSIKYEHPNDRFLLTNNLWKFYQNKVTDAPILPLFFILTTFDANKLLNFANVNEIGLNPILESNAFKKIKLFSKSSTTDLIHSPASSFLIYKNLSSLYTLKLNYLSSYAYGSKKQHNFLTNYALINNQKTYFNANSIKTLFTFNYPINTTDSVSTFIKTLITSNEHGASPYKKFNEYLLLNLYYDKKWQFLNLNSDKKQIFPISLKIFNKHFLQENFFVKIGNLLKANPTSENFLFKNTSSKFDFLINRYVETSPFQKNSFNLFSANQGVGTTEKTISTFFKFSPNTIFLNHAPIVTAMNSLIVNRVLQKNVLTTFSNFYTTFGDNLQNPSFIKIGSQRLSFDTPYSPIVSTNAALSPSNYDTNRVSETPLILQGKEELIPASAISAYWNFYFTTSNPLLKFSQLRNLNSRSVELYLPFFTFYYDYDFRNIQTSELIEDSLWETVYPFFLQFEYIDLRTNFSTLEKLLKLEKVYNRQNRNSTTLSPNSSPSGVNEYSSLFFVDDAFSNFKVLATKNFFFSPFLYLINLTEDSYDMTKMLLALNNEQNGVQLFSQFSFLTTHYYTTILDAFKSNFEEFNFFEPTSENFKKNNKTVRLFGNKEWDSSLSARDDNTERNAFLHLNSEMNYPIAEATFRFSNSLNLRGTAKNSITTYNALQKVFKTRFDENRSHAKLFDLASSYESVPFLTETKLPYENMLGKNKHSFLHLSWYKTSPKAIFNSNFNLETTLNFYFYEFPFLLALKSDSSRYIWFDWFSKWGYYEVQPSSSSRYAVFGLPYFNKNFDFATSSNENLNETENYLTRIAHSRKNYIPSWSYSPYFFFKNNIWFNQNIFFFINSLQLTNSLTEAMLYLQYTDWYWTSYCGYLNHLTTFAPTNSNTSTYNRTASINNASSQGYYYLMSTLADSLTKREFLYRELFFTTNKISDLSKVFANSPKSALFWEIKAILGLLDFHEINSEYSRNSFYSALTEFKNNYVLSLFPVSISSRFDQLASRYSSIASSAQSGYSAEFLKNQYKPMKKGIINMIRLHATGAMALPIEIRLQVLASSKDVIHSWAIPSAGIKIDCVPGYSSHRVMIFLVAGIYWGQCMEICGRYHHWMPIVVYFMKRDLFFLWCTHFIHLNNSSIWSTNEKQYNDLYKPVSFDRSLWLKELTN